MWFNILLFVGGLSLGCWIGYAVGLEHTDIYTYDWPADFDELPDEETKK